MKFKNDFTTTDLILIGTTLALVAIFVSGVVFGFLEFGAHGIYFNF